MNGAMNGRDVEKTGLPVKTLGLPGPMPELTRRATEDEEQWGSELGFSADVVAHEQLDVNISASTTAEIKATAVMAAASASAGAITYGPSTKPKVAATGTGTEPAWVQRLELKDDVLDFLTGPQVESTDPLELTSLRHIREILYQCRILYQAKPGPAAGTDPRTCSTH